MLGNYRNDSDYSNIFNVSGQNIMTNNKNIQTILNENKNLKKEISIKNRQIEDAKKRLNIIEREIENLRKQKNYNNRNQNRGRSVGMRNTHFNNNNNYINNNLNNINIGMFNENDPFNDSFFQFQ